MDKIEKINLEEILSLDSIYLQRVDLDGHEEFVRKFFIKSD